MQTQLLSWWTTSASTNSNTPQSTRGEISAAYSCPTKVVASALTGSQSSMQLESYGFFGWRRGTIFFPFTRSPAHRARGVCEEPRCVTCRRRCSTPSVFISSATIGCSFVSSASDMSSRRVGGASKKGITQATARCLVFIHTPRGGAKKRGVHVVNVLCCM
jgi:hypothetical protein